MLPKLDIAIIVDEASQLPALPQVLDKILKEIDNPDTKLQDFQEMILNDPVLTSKVLKLANSAYYGLPQKIETITKALIILGLESLKSLVISISVYSYLNKSCDSYKLAKGELWHHSLTTAILSKKLSKNIFLEKEGEKYFICGLLHDIGKTLLNKYIKRFRAEISDYIEKTNSEFHIAEKTVLGYNHAEIGAELMKLWQLPCIFYDVIKYHHFPHALNNQNRTAANIIYSANIIANRSKGKIIKEDKTIFAELNIKKEFIERIIEEAKKEADDFSNCLKIL